jgi:hypothetical protein
LLISVNVCHTGAYSGLDNFYFGDNLNTVSKNKNAMYNNLVMTIQDWASLIVAILTIVSTIAFGIKWLVKHYLVELKPNSGSSMKDQISRLETALDDQRIDSIKSRDRQEKKLDDMYQILIDHIASTNK